MSAPTPQAPTPDEPSASPPDNAPASPLARAKGYYDLVSDVITPQTLFILLAAAIIGVTGLVGGWNNVATAEKTLPTIAPSATATASPFQLSLTKGVWFDKEESIGLYQRDDSRYIMVAVRVTNLSSDPVQATVLGYALTPQLEGLATLPNAEKSPEQPRFFKVADARPVLLLQPGLTYDLAVIWRQEKAAPPPTSLQVDLNSATFRLSSIDASQDWRDPTPSESVTIPIKESQQ